MNKNILFLTLLAALLFSIHAEAANQVIVVPVPGNSGVFYLKGIDFVNVDGVEVEVEYDASALTNPRIAQGSLLEGFSFIPNPKFSSKSVKIAAMRASPLKGSGDIAIITFDLKGTSPGTVFARRPVLSISTSPQSPSVPAVATSGGTTGFIPGSVTAATNTSSTTSASGAVSSATTVTGGSNFGGGAGTITVPQDQMASSERKPEYQPLVTDLRKDMTVPASSAGSSQAGDTKQSGADAKGEKKFVSYKSVLQLFKEYKGARNSKALIALFAEAPIQDFSQSPLVAISDGVTPLKLTLLLKPSGKEAPKFIMQGANVKELRGEGEDGKWFIDVLPKKGVSEAKLTVIDGNTMMEFPLTVAPPVDVALAKSAKISEADFALFLAKPSKYDLNKDTKFDAVDDFIYSANYIVAMKIKPEKLKESDKKAVLKQEPKAEDTGKKVPVDKEIKGEKKKKSITDKKEINGTPKDKPAVKKTAPVKNGKSAEDDK